MKNCEQIIMEALAKSFLAIMLMNLIGKGYCKCTVEDMTFGDVGSGRTIKGVFGEGLGVRPIDVRTIIVFNYCDCPVSHIVMYCRDFESIIKVNPSMFKKIDKEHCLVNSGSPLLPFHSVKFDYAGDGGFMSFTSIKAKC